MTKKLLLSIIFFADKYYLGVAQFGSVLEGFKEAGGSNPLTQDQKQVSPAFYLFSAYTLLNIYFNYESMRAMQLNPALENFLASHQARRAAAPFKARGAIKRLWGNLSQSLFIAKRA